MMYLLRNAWKNLARNKGRNIAILMIAALTLTAVTISFSIQTMSSLAIARYKENFGVQATLETNWEKVDKEHPPEQTVNEDGSVTMEQNFEVVMPDAEEYARYADSKYVRRTLYQASCAVYSDSLRQVDDNLQQGEEIVDLGGMDKKELMKFYGASTEAELEEMLGGKEELETVLDTKANAVGSLIGFTDLSLLDEFATQQRKLEQGAFPKNRNECIVSNVFAEKNDLGIGDVISVSGPSRSLDQEDVQLTIVGIYGDYFNEATAITFGTFYGDIFTTYDTLMNTGFHYIDLTDAVFILKDADAAEAFEREIRAKGLNEYLSLSYSTEEYEKNTKPLENLAHIAEIFTGLASAVGAAVLLFVSFINVRERRYEIGVLRSIGMRRSDIAKGMIYELLAMMLAAFAGSVLLGSALVNPIASALLGGLAADVPRSLPAVSVAFSAGLAFALSVAASVCASLVVMRHEPMKILCNSSA